MLSAAKALFLRVSPAPVKKAALAVVRKGTAIRCRADMLLFPQKTTCYCPCCGMRFRSFVEGPFRNRPQRFNPQRYAHTRQDVLCPCCKSLPRHRILALWCEEHASLLRRAEILYFAPEYSMMLWMRRNGISCVTADLYGEADLRLDIQATGLPDESYDVIVCNHVLEHVDDFRVVLKELYRILRPGGSLVCSFPMDPNVELLDEDPEVRTEEERVRRFGQNDHLRVFGMHADRFLEEAGFTVEEINGDKCPPEVLPIVGPADYDINRLFRCVKGD